MGIDLLIILIVNIVILVVVTSIEAAKYKSLEDMNYTERALWEAWSIFRMQDAVDNRKEQAEKLNSTANNMFYTLVIIVTIIVLIKLTKR